MAEVPSRNERFVAVVVISIATAMIVSPSIDGSAVGDGTWQLLAGELTCNIHGWVNDSATMQGIEGAIVIIMFPSDDMFETNQTLTNGTGYYEMEGPRGETMAGFIAYGYYANMSEFDTTGLSEYRLDVLLEPEPTVPSISMELDPVTNVSAQRPLAAHVTSEDFNILLVELLFGPVLDRSGDWVNFTMVDAAVAAPGLYLISDSFVYTYEDDLFDGVCTWSATVQASGYLVNETDSVYVNCRSHRTINDDESYGIPGRYWNDTLTEEPGFAYFDNATGEYLGTEFMNTTTFEETGIPASLPDDPYGVFAPSDLVYTGTIVHNDFGDTFSLSGEGYWERIGDQMSTPELTFEYTDKALSGDYAALAAVLDDAYNMNMTIGFFTVDTDPPTADAGEDQEVAAGDEVTLSGEGSTDNVGIAEYTWTFEDDGQSVTLYGETASYVFTEPGDHTVTLVVSDGGLNEASDTVLVSVEGDECPVARAGPASVTVPEDVPTTFDGSDSEDDDGITAYSWEIVELDVEHEGIEFTYTFETPGTYHVELVVTDTIGQESEPDTVTVTVTDETSPVADAGDDVYVGAGETFLLTGAGSSDNVGVVNYSWSCEAGDGWQAYGETVEGSFDEIGTYDIVLVVSDAAGNTATGQVTVHVEAANEAPVADAGDDVEVEVGGTVEFDAEQSSDDDGIANYTWTFEYDGGTVTLYGESAEFTFDEVGTYNVNLTVEDGDGLMGYDEVVITVVEKASSAMWYALFAGVVVAAVIGAAVIMVSKRRGKAV